MDKRKRNRKNSKQIRYLMSEFDKDPNWTKETCNKVSRETGLTESQVYKWGWDQKNKIEKDPLSCSKMTNDLSYLKQGFNNGLSDKLNDGEMSSMIKTHEANTDILTPIMKQEQSCMTQKVAQFSP